MKCKDWKTGYSSCFYNGMMSLEDAHGEKAMSLMKAAGIDCMELSSNLEGYMSLNYFTHPEKFREAADKTGMELWSVHLPFSQALDISTCDPVNRENTIRINIEMIRAAAKAGFKVAVVHPSSEPIADTEREQRMQYSINGLRILSELCGELGMTAAVEDLPRTCLAHDSAEMLRLLDACPELRVVFDTNHILEMNHDDNVNFVKNVGSRIITTHVSDYDFIDERHKLPFDGKNDWKAIVKALEDAGYCGPFLYEINWKATDREELKPITPAILKKTHMDIAAL